MPETSEYWLHNVFSKAFCFSYSFRSGILHIGLLTFIIEPLLFSNPVISEILFINSVHILGKTYSNTVIYLKC